MSLQALRCKSSNMLTNFNTIAKTQAALFDPAPVQKSSIRTIQIKERISTVFICENLSMEARDCKVIKNPVVRLISSNSDALGKANSGF